MLVIVGLFLTLCSCENTKNMEEVNENTELPSKITKALKDTSLVFDSKLIVVKDNTYVLVKEKNEVVVKNKIPNEGSEVGVFWAGVILAIILIFVLFAFFSEF